MSLCKLVAIVDDDEDITMLFKDALNGIKGITVFTFTDPILALEHFQENKDKYALVISDYKMPGLNGIELLRKMKDANKYVRTVLMTAFEVENNTFREYMKREVVQAFCQKPVRLSEFTELVHSQLHSYGMQKRIPTQR